MSTPPPHCERPRIEDHLHERPRWKAPRDRDGAGIVPLGYDGSVTSHRVTVVSPVDEDAVHRRLERCRIPFADVAVLDSSH